MAKYDKLTQQDFQAKGLLVFVNVFNIDFFHNFDSKRVDFF